MASALLSLVSKKGIQAADKEGSAFSSLMSGKLRAGLFKSKPKKDPCQAPYKLEKKSCKKQFKSVMKADEITTDASAKVGSCYQVAVDKFRDCKGFKIVEEVKVTKSVTKTVTKELSFEDMLDGINV